MKKGLVFLIVLGALLAGGSAWAAHDCCGHPSGTSQTRISGNESSSSDGDCVCTCCQSVTAISSLTGISFRLDPRWSIQFIEECAVSHAGPDIFRPPLS
jgi:hypothetical protein